MTNRILRLASEAKKELSQMLLLKNIKSLKDQPDQKLDGLISIVEVKVENGYKHFRIFVSSLDQSENNKKNILNILEKAIPEIRGELCRRLRLRIAPSLSFHFDESIKRASEVNILLDKITNSENKPE